MTGNKKKKRSLKKTGCRVENITGILNKQRVTRNETIKNWDMEYKLLTGLVNQTI